MKCPKCKKKLIKWDCWDLEENNIPTFVNLAGFGCFDCRLTFIDLEESGFDGYISAENEIKAGEIDGRMLICTGNE
ncbi:MAG: hypothetical protein GY928_34210 [Colwellia sp.]|nr:hypothetical protein [Colwellia sp.]